MVTHQYVTNMHVRPGTYISQARYAADAETAAIVHCSDQDKKGT